MGDSLLVQVSIRLGDLAVKAALYELETPVTVNAFLGMLPLGLSFFQSRDSGTELLRDEGPSLRVPQEDLSVHRSLEEMAVEVPISRFPKGFKGAMSIIYGSQASPRQCMNVFARVVDGDLGTLEAMGVLVWQRGVQELEFFKEV